MNTRAVKTLILMVPSVVLHGFAVKSKPWKDPGEAGMCMPVESFLAQSVPIGCVFLYSGLFSCCPFPQKGTSTIEKVQ